MTNKTLTSPVINTGTLASPVINTGVSGTAILDEDNMASDSDTQLATQQSIKAYVDAVDALLPSGLSGGNDSNGETSIGELQIKWGKVSRSGLSTTVDYTNLGLSDFSNACFQAYAVSGTNQAVDMNTIILSVTKTGFIIRQDNVAETTMRWFAIGR